MMNIVITMGGLGSRFRKVGYTMPKYMIKVKGNSLFEWSMLSLRKFFYEKFIFIVKKEDSAKEFIKLKCDKLGITNYSIIEINKLTRGQAETVLFAKEQWNELEGLFIYNIDTYIANDMLQPELISGDGFIPCFYGEGDHWSFVKIDDDNEVVEVREKQRISKYCSIGAYYFKNCLLYQNAYSTLYLEKKCLECGEQYIAPLYNILVKCKKKIRIQLIDNQFVHVLGTPEEVHMFEAMK